MKFIDLNNQYKKIKLNLLKKLKINLKNTDFIIGKNVKLLEKKLLEFSGSKYCISCANGTDALTLALMSINLNQNEIVFVPSFTYVSTAESVAQIGGKPFFVDVDKLSYNIDTYSLEKSILDAKKKKFKIKAIIAVDLFGLPCDRKKLSYIAKKYKLTLIIDSAQGFGLEYDGKKFAEYGDIVTTSFFPSKPLGCYGDGGAIFTNNKKIAKKLYSLRVHGSGKNKYDNVLIGMNSRLDTLQATILLEKLKIFSKELSIKNKISQYYNRNISDKFTKPLNIINSKSGMALYTLQSKKRNEIVKFLNKKKIPTAIYYSKPLHQQKAYRHYPLAANKCKISEILSKEVFSIPLHAYLKKKDVKRVVNTLNIFSK